MNDKIARLLSFATPMVLALSLSCGAQPVDNQNDPAFAPEQGAKAPAVLDIPPELEAIASQQPAPRKVPRRAVAQADESQGAPGQPPSAAPSNPPPSPPRMTVPPPPNFTPGGVPPARRSMPVLASKPSPAAENAATPAFTGPNTNLLAAGMNAGDSVGEQSFSDMSVNDILEMLQNLTGKSVLRQNSVAGTFSFKSNGPMTRGQAVDAIVSLLALNGVSITPLGDRYLKAVPATTAASNAPYFIDGSTLEYEPSQVICTKLFQIDFMAVTEAVTALSAMQSGLVGTSITPFEKNRSVLATDSMVNLQRMENLLGKVDKPEADKGKILFFPLKNIAAKDAMTRAQQMLSGSLVSRFQGNTTVDADERTNQLIVYTHPANENLIRQLVDNLDKDVEPLTRTEMYSIRHADVTELCDVIKEVITGQKQVRTDTTAGSASRSATAAQSARQQQRAQQTTQAQAVVDNAGTQFSNYITIVPDERTNQLVATGTQSDLRLLSEIVSKLDAVLPQVRIEVIIAEVTLTKNQSSGLESFGVRFGSKAPTGSLSGDPGTNGGLNNGGNDLWLTPTFSNSDIGRAMTVTPFSVTSLSMDAVFQVAKTNGNVQVLSAPNIVTTHNREASIIVGSKEPVVSSYSTAATSTSDENVASISYEDVALELTVKPLIGSNGVVQMEITQKVNEVTSRITIAGYGDQPVIGTRQASSFVSVADGGMVVLGGLQKLKTTRTRNKVFILGDIPLLGRIFQPKFDETVRTELIIFIRPVILANPNEADVDAKKKISEVAPSEEINNYIDSGNFRPKKKEPAATHSADKPRPRSNPTGK